MNVSLIGARLFAVVGLAAGSFLVASAGPSEAQGDGVRPIELAQVGIAPQRNNGEQGKNKNSNNGGNNGGGENNQKPKKQPQLGIVPQKNTNQPQKPKQKVQPAIQPQQKVIRKQDDAPKKANPLNVKPVTKPVTQPKGDQNRKSNPYVPSISPKPKVIENDRKVVPPQNKFETKPVQKIDPDKRVAPKIVGPDNKGIEPGVRRVPGNAYVRPATTKKKLDDLQKNRKKQIGAGGNLVVIREPDKRIIVKDKGRLVIQNDQSDRLRRLSKGSKTNIIRDGNRETVIVRPNGVRVVDVTDRYGRIVHRYKVLPNGDRITIIDNRGYWKRHRRRDNYGRDIALGIGAGILIGAAIVALAPPAVAIPQDKYIVDYDHASDDDIYEAFSSPPVEVIERRYSLEEVRYSDSLRQRMRRVDVDTVTFDFGSWDVGPEQYPALERIARGINRVIDGNPDEVFLIEGHTDAVGSEEDNLSLSDRRAQSVAEILSAEFDVPPENIVTQGYGEQYLKIGTSEPDRRNRRITVRRITPLLAESEREEDYDGR
ncbi:MAG: OmpA family protein [Hyphomicrobium sp.]|nr:OmpA family protein [Hyphomicrobium sp.]